MDIVFNELSLQSIPTNYEECSSWFFYFFENCFALSKIIEEQINLISPLKFSEIYTNTDFSFSKWIGKLEKGSILKSQILSFITRNPVVKNYPFYSYNGHISIGLGIAFEYNTITVSFPAYHWSEPFIKTLSEYFDAAENPIENSIYVRNVSCEPHIKFHEEWLKEYKREFSLIARNLAFPVRYYEHHNKHDRERPNLNDGNATLYCTIDEAKRLLTTAYGENTMLDGRLYNYDPLHKMIIVFNKTREQIYHGYHLEINHNRIPNSIRRRFGFDPI